MATNTISFKIYLISTLCFAALGAGVTLLAAGPLAPPSGAVTSTNKTLGEVEPRTAINSTNTPGDGNSRFRIITPGSYYLTGNIVGIITGNGIEIAASNVTIDMGGFTMTGSNIAADGITTDALCNNITIRNGTISGFGSDGINLTTGGAGEGFRIEGISALSNGGFGIRVASRVMMRSCIATGNGSDGINITSRATVSECVATGNGSRGFSVGAGSTLTGCTAADNTGDGYSLPSTATVSNCTATNNTGRGFFGGIGSTFAQCLASDNTAEGFSLTGSATLNNCTSRSNGGRGFLLGTGSTIKQCTAISNGSDGISLITQCLASGNNCASNTNAANTAAGIIASGAYNTIEANLCTSNNVGIQTAGSRNTIRDNVCVDSAPGTVEFRVTGSFTLVTRNIAHDHSTVGNPSDPYSVSALGANVSLPIDFVNVTFTDSFGNPSNPWANFKK